MSVPLRARLLPAPEAGGPGDNRTRRYRYLAASGIFGTAPATDGE